MVETNRRPDLPVVSMTLLLKQKYFPTVSTSLNAGWCFNLIHIVSHSHFYGANLLLASVLNVNNTATYITIF